MADNQSNGSQTPLGGAGLVGDNPFLTAPEKEVPSGQPNPAEVEKERKLIEER